MKAVQKARADCINGFLFRVEVEHVGSVRPDFVVASIVTAIIVPEFWTLEVATKAKVTEMGAGKTVSVLELIKLGT